MPSDSAQNPEKPPVSADPEMYEVATRLGGDPEMSDVDFAFGAQAEVVAADG